MKRLLTLMLIATTFLSGVFAKSMRIDNDKIDSIKEIEKLVQITDWEILENTGNLYLAASEDRKDFAIIFYQRGDGGDTDFFVVSYDNKLFSSLVVYDEGKTFKLKEDQVYAQRKPGKKGEYDLDIALHTIKMIFARIDIRQQIADLYDLEYPEYVQKNDALFMKAYSENWSQIIELIETDQDENDEFYQLVNGTIESYFTYKYND